MISHRAFLHDFDDGVHAYLAGNFIDAEKDLLKAHDRRPGSPEVQQLLLKALIEQSFAQYHKKDFIGALETLSRASHMTPLDAQTQETLSALREQFSAPPKKRPVDMDHLLGGLYRHLPIQEQPSSLQSLMEEWLQRSQTNQEATLKRFWDNQEQWLAQLEREKDQFKKILYGGLALFGTAAIILLLLLVGVLHAYFGRRGVFSRLLENHYQRLVAALPAGTQVLLGPPVNLLSVPESRQMDAIEAEIISGDGAEKSHRRLELLLEGENPWVRARAAKILYRLNPKLSIEELRRLVAEPFVDAQISGMWALSELAAPEALDLLASMAYSTVREIQQGAVRSLLQLQSKKNLPPIVDAKLTHLLSEIRSRTGWIF
jgi:hypothetical protein